MNRVLLDNTGTTLGVTVTFPAKLDFTWQIQAFSGKMDLIADINIIDDIEGDNNKIWSVNGSGSFEFALHGNWFGRKGKSLSVVITDSIAACELYVSAEFH